MVSVWVAEVSLKVAVCEPGVLVTLLTLVKMSVCPPLEAVETVPAWLAVIEIELVAGFAEMVKVFDKPNVPLKVRFVEFVLSVVTLFKAPAPPLKVMNPERVKPL